jgi:hypothetical protein
MVMGDVTEIGKCIGCDKGPRRIDGGVCPECLGHPKRGRKWAEMSHRIRTEPEFALISFNEIGVRKPAYEITGKTLFIRDYGFPEGAVPSPALVEFIQSHPDTARHPRIKAFLDTWGSSVKTVTSIVRDETEDEDSEEEPEGPPRLRLVR